MACDLLPVRRALLSVSDKTGLVPFGQALAARGVDDALVFARQRIDRAAFFAAFAHAVWPRVERQSDAAMPTTSAVLGGLVAQDLLNALGRREAPLVNWLLLDTSTGTAPVCAVGTPAPAARALGADGSL